MPNKRRKAVHDMQRLLHANKAWADHMRHLDPEFFERLVHQQTPEYLWIGCSDSRVPANQILGLQPGEIFVQRNVGNLAMHTDLNCMSCLEYAVKTLKVKSVIVCGHYGCGAVKAALQLPTFTQGLVNCWITDIRECRNQSEEELRQIHDPDAQLARLCELNVLRQTFHVCTSPIVAAAWAEGQELHVWGLVYSVEDGHIKRLAGPISADNDYEHNLDAFTAAGLCTTCAPGSDALRLSMGLSDAGGAASGSSSASSAGTSDSGAAAVCDAAVLTKLQGLRMSSEMRATLNSASLMDAISRHSAWGNT